VTDEDDEDDSDGDFEDYYDDDVTSDYKNGDLVLPKGPYGDGTYKITFAAKKRGKVKMVLAPLAQQILPPTSEGYESDVTEYGEGGPKTWLHPRRRWQRGGGLKTHDGHAQASRKNKAMNTLKQPAGAVPVGAAPIPTSTAALAIAARAAPANCWAELITPSSLDSVVVTRRRRRVTSFAFPFGNVGILIEFVYGTARTGPVRSTTNKTSGRPRACGHRFGLVLNVAYSHVRCALCLITTQLLTAYEGKATLRPKHRRLCHA
jgi:hypothetical protein